MTSLTKKAIRDSFLKLLNQRPINQITIKDIVEDCGINRNSFYYHYQDLPSMIEEIILEEVNEIIRNHPSIDSMEECLDVAISFAMENRRAALHLYNSPKRDLFEQYLWRVCEYTVSTYINTAFSQYPMKEGDRDILIRYYKWICFGAILDWLNEGMKGDVQKAFYRIGQLKRGMLEEVIRRSSQESGAESQET